MAFTPYRGENYLDYFQLSDWCKSAAEAFPGILELTEIGQSRQKKPIWMLRLGDKGASGAAFWLDGGTHAPEWVSVAACLHHLSYWLEESQNSAEFAEWLKEHAVYIVPCISPDGYQAMQEGAPMVRSNLRPLMDGKPFSGLLPKDINGDQTIHWMRIKHPAGPFVEDEEEPLFMRHRTLDDDPDKAYYLSFEGEFVNWDGNSFTAAPLEHGLDLNRNFNSRWAPFSMFGMDSGTYALSEPESRAVTESFASIPNICAALTLHSYTGAILSQPYSANTPLGDADIRMMDKLARHSVRETNYKTYRVHPEFTYDAKMEIVGVWADTMSTVFGVPAYTLELWNPFDDAEIEIPSVAEFFREPPPQVVRKLIQKARSRGQVSPWQEFEHPQLGKVEIGGINYMHSIRNPPPELLEKECRQSLSVAKTMLKSLAEVKVEPQINRDGAYSSVALSLENLGFLPTSGLAFGAQLPGTQGVSAQIELGEGLKIVSGAEEQFFSHLEGWGEHGGKGAAHPIYPRFPFQGSRAQARWRLQGSGEITINYLCGRAGKGQLKLVIEPE